MTHKHTKKEIISGILYDVYFRGTADFEADGQSFTITKQPNGYYRLQGQSVYCVESQNISGLRPLIARCGKNITQM